MFKRVVQVVVGVLVATTGVVALAIPAGAAVGACRPTTIITACVNYGDSGTRIRADFYINRRPDADQRYYRVAIHILQTDGDDFGMWVSPLNTIGSTGRYCCWYRNDLNSPPYYRGAKTVVYTYTADRVVHSVFSSPSIWYRS